METYTCVTCNMELPLTHEYFGRRVKHKNGFKHTCRKCASEITKKSRIVKLYEIVAIANECWLDIAGYEGLYKISNMGRVMSVGRCVMKSLNNKPYTQRQPDVILKHCLTRGYPCVNLTKNSIGKTTPIHKLVAIHFIPNLENKPCINHIDGVKTNSISSNLEWCTYSENLKHAWDNNLR